ENCIGCGQCAVQCPFPVRVLRRNERQVFVRTKRRTHA
ncbi:MAG: 4Fe-4S binding protein, partial [Butyricicoccus porcorum]